LLSRKAALFGRIERELGGNWIVATIMGKVAMITEEVAMINTKVPTIESLEQNGLFE